MTLVTVAVNPRVALDSAPSPTPDGTLFDAHLAVRTAFEE
jgi:hypothetical protein